MTDPTVYPLTPLPREIPKAEVRCKHQPPYDTPGCPVCAIIVPDPAPHELGMQVSQPYRESFQSMIAIRADAYKWDRRARWATHALNAAFYWFAVKTMVRSLTIIYHWPHASDGLPGAALDAIFAVGLYFQTAWLERQNAGRFK